MSKAKGPLTFQGPTPVIGHNRSLSQNLSQKRQSGGLWQLSKHDDRALHLHMFVARIFFETLLLKTKSFSFLLGSIGIGHLSAKIHLGYMF